MVGQRFRGRRRTTSHRAKCVRCPRSRPYGRAGDSGGQIGTTQRELRSDPMRAGDSGGSNSRRYVWVSVDNLPGVSEPSLLSITIYQLRVVLWDVRGIYKYHPQGHTLDHVGVLPEDLGKTLPIPYRSGYPPPQMSSRNRSFDRRSASQDCASSAEPPVRLR
jgi:hypothetical protein